MANFVQASNGNGKTVWLPTTVEPTFTYLNTLKNYSSGEQLLSMVQQQIRNDLSKLGMLRVADTNNAEIDYALEFLRQCALSEQGKEIAFIRSKKQQYEKLCPNTREGQEVSRLFTEIEGCLSKADTITDFYTFYNSMIQALNIIRKDVEKMQEDIRHFDEKFYIRTKDKNPTLLYERLAERIKELNLRVRMAYQDMPELAKDLNLQGTYDTNANTQMMHREIGKCIERFFASHKANDALQGVLSDGIKLTAFCATLIGDMTPHIQKILDEKTYKMQKGVELKDFKQTIIELTSKEIEAGIQEYEQQERRTPFQQAIDENDAGTLNRILDNAIGIFNIQYDEKVSVPQQPTQDPDSLYAVLNRLISAPGSNVNVPHVQKQLAHVAIKLGQSPTGPIGEFLGALLSKALTLNVSGPAAADLLTLDIVVSSTDDKSFKNSNDYKDIYSYFSKIEEALTNLSRQSLRTQAEIEAKSKEIRDLMNKIKQSIAKWNSQFDQLRIENCFVIHESLKFYQSLETNWYSQELKGRTFTVSNYLESIAALSENGAFSPVDAGIFTLAAHNLLSKAAGAAFKEDVEYYFSIFAGMIMFDDLSDMGIGMAQSTINSVQSADVTALHLYNVNGVYIPASMLLHYTYEKLSKGFDILKQNVGAEAKIILNDKQGVSWAKLEEDLPDSVAERWTAYGQRVYANTRVRVIFMRQFVQFIESLTFQ